ncbi:MAG: OmpH family outer membrane protein [Planctomycetota bacterium]
MGNARSLAGLARGIVGALVLLGGAAPLLAQGDQAQPPAGRGAPLGELGAKVGVVDLDQAFKAYPRARHRMEAWNNAKADTNTALEEEFRRVEKLRIERDGYDPLTKEWIGANSNWQAALAALESRKKYEEERFLRDKEQIQAECLKDISQAIRQLAQRRGLVLVLRAWPLGDDASVGATLSRQTVTDVLFFDGRLDLTEDLIKFLTSSTPPGESASDRGSG